MLVLCTHHSSSTATMTPLCQATTVATTTEGKEITKIQLHHH